MSETTDSSPAGQPAPLTLPPASPPRKFVERRSAGGKSSAVKALANASTSLPAGLVLVWYVNNFVLVDSYSPVDGELIQINGEVGVAIGTLLGVLFAIIADIAERFLQRRNLPPVEPTETEGE